MDYSETFPTKKDAQVWVNQMESEETALRLGQVVPGKTFADLLNRYLETEVPKKRGARSETCRINRVIRDEPELSAKLLTRLGADDFAAWRDRRLKNVSAAAVLRDWNTLSAACNVAVKEWRWLQMNPMSQVRRPSQPAARTQRFTTEQIEQFLVTCDYDDECPMDTMQRRIAAAFCFSLETAMRAGEICKLTWDNVNYDRRLAHLPMTKNGTSRDVPLSQGAMRILRRMNGVLPSNKERQRRVDENSVFHLTEPRLDAMWRKLRDRSLLDGMHFHDARATALTRLANKLNPLELAKMSGHKDLKMLLNVYYREDPSVIAAKLD
jgi:integrase